MTTIPLAEARASLSRLVDEAVRTHQRVEVTRKGRRAVVILSAEDYDSIMETLDILSDPRLVREIREAEAKAERGEVFSLDEVAEGMRAHGRLPQNVLGKGSSGRLLLPRASTSTRCQTSGHQPDHGPLDHRLGVLR